MEFSFALIIPTTWNVEHRLWLCKPLIVCSKHPMSCTIWLCFFDFCRLCTFCSFVNGWPLRPF